MSTGEDSGRRDALATVLQLVATVAVYLVAEADPATLQALRMRGWHYAARGAWWASARCAEIGYRAGRRYDAARG